MPEIQEEAMRWSIPRIGDTPALELSLGLGQVLFVVGANGTGKSALLQHLATAQPGQRVRWITAHRQNWFQSGAVELTPKGRRDWETRSASQDVSLDSRWTDRLSAQRLSAVLFDLVATENERARSITQHVDEADIAGATALSRSSKSAFKSLNELLALGTLTVSLRNSKGEEILAKHPNTEQFSLAKMSDGERNAAIIASHVLTVEPGTLIIIDEPERHLHRAITEPFLTALVARRPDCPFIVATHELALPAGVSDARTLIPRSCEWQGDRPSAWELRVLEPDSGLPEDLKAAILGSRERLLFVEGRLSSLDLPLYSALFPGTSVIPKDGCGEVQRAVTGLRDTLEHHHVEVFGLVDRDDRTEAQVSELAARHVYALEVHSAESLYYSVDVIAAVADRQAESMGSEAEVLRNNAISAALKVLSDPETQLRLAARRCESRVRAELLGKIPNWKSIMSDAGQSISFSVNSPFAEEAARIRSLVDQGSWDEISARYPVRETPALGRIAEALRCSSKSDYEQMVLARVEASSDLASSLRAKIRALADALEA